MRPLTDIEFDSGDTSLFIFAHPDDELAFSPVLHALITAGRRVRILYLTDGASAGVTSATRNAESIAALAYIGITTPQISFVGSEVGIPDGELYLHVDRAMAAVDTLSCSWEKIGQIYSFAWEGGHADHDAALIVAAVFAMNHQLNDRVWQLPFYRASDVWPAPMFTLSAPLADNGPVVPLTMTAEQRRLPRRMIRFYPSQRRTFIGLGPFIFLHSLTRRTLGLQRLRYDRLWRRPTPRPLLYERRNGISFDTFSATSTAFLESRGIFCDEASDLETVSGFVS